MIASLRGVLVEKTPSMVLLDVQGVGYEVFISLSTFDRLPAKDAACFLFIYHHIREDAQTLFGFSQKEEKRMFERLINVNGVGPKLALSVLSGLTVAELTRAIAERDVKRISSVHGIGKKTAERIVLDLRDKVDPLEAFATADGNVPETAMLRDTALALESLGFAQDQARKMAQEAFDALPNAASTEDLLRRALNSK